MQGVNVMKYRPNFNATLTQRVRGWLHVWHRFITRELFGSTLAILLTIFLLYVILDLCAR